MGKTNPVALMIALIIAIFLIYVALTGSTENMEMYASQLTFFIIFFILLFIAFKYGKLKWKGKKKTRSFISEKPREKKESNVTHYSAYKWGGYGVVSGDAEFMLSTFKIPYPGVLITKKNDFAVFKRTDEPIFSKEEILRIATETLKKLDYDLIIAWQGNWEMACGGAEYIKVAYGIDYGGLILKEGEFIHLFGHACRGVTKNDMLKFIKEHINRSEIALGVLMEEKVILSFKDFVAEKVFGASQDLLSVTYPDELLTYFYAVPFKIRRKKELIDLAAKEENAHREIGAFLQNGDTGILVARRDLAAALIPNLDEEGDVMAIYKDSGKEPIVKPVEWRAWTREELIKEAERHKNVTAKG